MSTGTSTQSLPSWLTHDLILEEEAYKPLERRWLNLTEDHINQMLVHGQKASEVMVEWHTEGIYVSDPLGKKYFDCLGAGGVFGLGFRHPRVMAAVKAQLDRVALSTRMGIVPAQGELAAKLIEVAPPGYTGVFFGNSGTESVEAAIKLARLATGRSGLVGTHFGYHGMSIGTISLSGLGLWRDGIGSVVADTELVQHGNLEELASKVNENTAAVVMEPIQWASGCKVVGPRYFTEVKKICEQAGALLILDEVQTGLGRTGRWFACEHWNVVPDLLCVGKVLSGGVIPISATLFGPQVHQKEKVRVLFNNSSFGGNPLACAAGYAAVEALQDGLLQRSEELGEQMEDGFDELCRDFSDLLEGHHGIGLMRCIEFTNSSHGALFNELMRVEQSVIVAAMAHIMQFVRISPPFICTDSDMQALLQACRACLERIREMGAEGVAKFFNQMMMRIRAVQTESRQRQVKG